MEGLVGNDQDLEQNPLFDGQPVQFFKDRSDMIKLAATGCEACSRILDALDFSHLGVWESRQGHVAVVEARRYEGVDKGLVASSVRNGLILRIRRS